MKMNLFFLLLILGLAACQNTNGPTVTMGEGPEINMLKSMVENYEKGDLDANLSFYADTAKIYRQGWGLASITAAEDVERSKELITYFSEYGISDEIYEVVTVDGMHWLHFWGVWTGKLKADSSEVKLPFFMNPGIKDGKIQMMSFYADNSIISNAIQKATAPPPIAEDVKAGASTTE